MNTSGGICWACQLPNCSRCHPGEYEKLEQEKRNILEDFSEEELIAEVKRRRS